MAKQVKFDQDARSKLLSGVNQLANAAVGSASRHAAKASDANRVVLGVMRPSPPVRS